jgi:hypothetical protein
MSDLFRRTIQRRFDGTNKIIQRNTPPFFFTHDHTPRHLESALVVSSIAGPTTWLFSLRVLLTLTHHAAGAPVSQPGWKLLPTTMDLHGPPLQMRRAVDAAAFPT